MENISFQNSELASQPDFFPFLESVRGRNESFDKTTEEREFKEYLGKMVPLFIEIPTIEEIEITFKESLMKTSQKY